jgi:glycosyltransferase involved in cell wall biosynthesis
MKTLLLAPSHSSFIHKDHEILSELNHTKLLVAWSFKEIYQACFMVLNYDTCIFWFASIRFIPIFIIAKISGKRIYIITGGYDVSVIPELKYGGVRPNSRLAFLRKLFISGADKVITVSNSNTKEAVVNANIPASKIELNYLGFDLPNIRLTPWRERKNQVVFIACCDYTSFKIKGFDTFLELARSMPHIDFIHVGRISVREFEVEAKKIPNVILKGFVRNLSGDFHSILNNAKIILLPSKIESFGASVVEGALHGCMPITSSSYALPEIVGEMGKVCYLNILKSFQIAIEEVITATDVDVNELQQYYFRRFNSNRRKEAFRKIFKA